MLQLVSTANANWVKFSLGCDVYRAISLETCTNERKAFGGPASENVKAQAKRVAEIAKNL